jgi:alpha-tubulin suppressor-like RCC1 family protein
VCLALSAHTVLPSTKLKSVGTPKCPQLAPRGPIFTAQWPARMYPCRRFALVLTNVDARLGASAVCYSFTVGLFHSFQLTGFDRRSEYLDKELGCVAHLNCTAGQFVLAEPTDQQDRVCQACPDGSFTTGINSATCSDWTVCPAGTASIGGQSGVSDRKCRACDSGEYCVGGEVLAQMCGMETWDNDSDPATQCTPVGECGPGEFVSAQPTPKTNRSCSDCPPRTFSTTSNSSQCAPWTDCPAGYFVSTQGSSTGDRACTPCQGVADLPTNAPACVYAKSIVAGNQHSCTLLTDGQVRCWGRGSYGRLGYGNTENLGDNETPTSAGSLELGGPVLQIAAGGEHTCAVFQGGSVRCWGRGDNGRLGYKSTSNVGDMTTPATAGNVDVGGAVAQIAVGGRHTCALLEGGRVRCWGWGERGQLGYGNREDIGDDETPASAGDVDLGGPVIQISAGGEHTCAVLANGRVRCWGDNSAAQLGTGWRETGPPSTFAVDVVIENEKLIRVGDDETPTSISEIDLGAPTIDVSAGLQHTCALRNDGMAFCWGYAPDGRIGRSATHRTNTSVSCMVKPTLVEYPSLFSSIAAGGSQSCATVAKEGVVCWGGNMVGEVGYPQKSFIGDSAGTPLLSIGFVDIGGGISRIATGQSHTCALLNDGNIRCWGLGNDGQLGIRGFAKTNQVGERFYTVGANESPSVASTVPYY